MAQIFPFSQAASIAFRSMVTIFGSEDNLNIDIISEKTGASRHHVAKVLQRLAQTGLIGSKRGPGGGFYLMSNPDSISLLDIYEAIEGKWQSGEAGNTTKSTGEPIDRLSQELSSHFITFLRTRTLSGYAEENKSWIS